MAVDTSPTQSPTPVQSPQTIYISILAPWALAVLGLATFAVLEIAMGGHVPPDVISFLETLILGGTLSGGATGVTHSIANASIQRTVVNAEVSKTQTSAGMSAGGSGPA